MGASRAGAAAGNHGACPGMPEPRFVPRGSRFYRRGAVLALLCGGLTLPVAVPARAQPADAALSGLAVEVSTDGTTFRSIVYLPEFSAERRSYDTVVSTDHTHVRVSPTIQVGAGVRVGKEGSLAPVASGSTSAPIALATGANQIRVRVGAEDGRNFRTYFLTVTRGGRVIPSPLRSVRASTGDARLILAWQEPVLWGSFPAGGYEVDWYAGSSPPADESDWERATPTPQPLAATATRYEFTGTYAGHTVANGTTYRLRVRGFGTNPDDSGDTLPSEWTTVSGTPQSGATLSTNADLGGLTAATGTSAAGAFTGLTLTPSTFSASTTAYTATVANARTHAKLTPTVADTGKATVTVGGTSVTSGSASGAITLGVGPNAITVRVTAESGATEDYIVTITREAAPATRSTNANLSGLTASSAASSGGPFATLNIGTFRAATTNYTASVANARTHLKLTPTVADTGKATVTVDGNAVTSGMASGPIALDVGSNAITVRVTAQDSSTKDYTVTVTRAAPPSSDATLRGLAASSATRELGTYGALPLTPSPFSPGTTSYAATVPNATTHVRLTATVNHASAMVLVGGNSATSGSPSGPIALDVGSNAITVRVTAQDSSMRDYAVTITRQAAGALPAVTLSAAPNPVVEGSSVTVTATLSRALSGGVTIPLTTTDNTAEPADHGTLASIAIAAGATSGAGTIATNHDPDAEDETFTVALGTLPSSVAAGTPGSVQIRIADDESLPTVTLSVAPNPVAEGSETTLTATLSEAMSPTQILNVPVVYRHGTSEQHDFRGTGAVLILFSSWSGSTRVVAVRDADGDDETFTVAVDETRLPSWVRAGSPALGGGDDHRRWRRPGRRRTPGDDPQDPPPAPQDLPPQRSPRRPRRAEAGVAVPPAIRAATTIRLTASRATTSRRGGRRGCGTCRRPRTPSGRASCAC